MKNFTLFIAALLFAFTANAQIIGTVCALPFGDDPTADRWRDCNANIITPTSFGNFGGGKVGIGMQAPATKFHVLTRETNPAGLNFGIRSEATGRGSNYALQGFSSGTMSGIGVGVLTNVSGDGSANFGVDVVVSGSPGGWIGAANYGVDVSVSGNAPTKYGIYTNASGANTNFGIFATAGAGTTNWAGYFAGSVFANTYVGSDRKLKSGIENYSGGLAQISRLAVKSYDYKTQEYAAMNLPEGPQVGLIAQELEAELPSLVKETIHIERNEENQTGVETSFKAVNYNGLVPVLISAVQELDQQNKMLAEELGRLQQSLTAMERGIDPEVSSAYLYANMPNPFNEQTVINYFLPENASNGTLQVFDINGKMVREYALETGEGQVTMEARSLSAGIYLYSLIANGKQLSSRQMVIAE